MSLFPFRFQYLHAQLKGQQGDFPFVIQTGFPGQAAGIPGGLVQIISGVQELEKVHIP